MDFLVIYCVVPRPLVIIKVLYDTRYTKKINLESTIFKTAILSCFQGQNQSRELFGLSVIEYLNYDPWSGHDTHDQKVLFRGHMDLNEIWPSNGFFGH